MAVAISTMTPVASRSYLTLAEFKTAPTSLSYDDLVVGGTVAAQDAELTHVIARASAWMDSMLRQSVIARAYTENQQVRVNSQGNLAIAPFHSPIVAFSALAYGTTPPTLTSVLDPSQGWIEDYIFTFPISGVTSGTTVGPLQFGPSGSSRRPLFIKYTYIAGFVNDSIVVATAAATSLTVKYGDGIVPGLFLDIPDGVSSEQVQVASTYVFGSTTVPLVAALAFTHAANVAIGNMPQDIKQVAIMAVSDVLKIRGDGSLAMSISTSASAGPATKDLIGSTVSLAKEMLFPYRRVR